MTTRILLFSCLCLLIACQEQTATQPVTRVLADGLLNPIGLARLPGDTLFIAEMGTGAGDNSGGISIITPQRQMGRLVSGLPSTLDSGTSGDLAGAPLVGVAPDGSKLYLSYFNAGHLWTLPLDEQSLSVPDEPLTTADLGTAMAPQIIDQLINAFDITFENDGSPVVSDASMNGVARQTAEGKTHFIHLFPRLPDPANNHVTIDAVPTGITRVGDEYYVTLTGGCPFPERAGQLVAIGQTRHERQILAGLNMPIDVAQDSAGNIWILEFAVFPEGGDCFTGRDFLPNRGRLLRLDVNGQLSPAITGLNTPGAFLIDADGTVFISEVFAGRVLEVHLPADESEWPISTIGVERDAQTLTTSPVPIVTLTPWFATRAKE